MRICKRILAALTILVSLVGLLASVAGGVGVWVVKEPTTAKVVHIFERIDDAFSMANQGLDHVKSSLDKAAERLESAKEEQRKIAQAPRKNNFAGRLLARTVQQRIAPELEDAHENLHTVAEAAVVVNSVLEDIGNFPLFSITGLDTGNLAAMNSQLADVGPRVWEMSRLLGESGSNSDSDADASVQLSRIERTLSTVQRLIAQYEPQLTEAHQRTDRLKSQTLRWITPAAVLISFTCFWIALSLISLMVHARSWWG